MYSRGISTCDAFAMRPRQMTPLRKVKEEAMHVAEATQTVATEYNGWSNRETWLVNMWLTNDRCYYDELCEIIKNFDLDEQAEELERYVRFITDTDNSIGIVGDLLNTSLGRTDWVEVVAANQ